MGVKEITCVILALEMMNETMGGFQKNEKNDRWEDSRGNRTSSSNLVFDDRPSEYLDIVEHLRRYGPATPNELLVYLNPESNLPLWSVENVDKLDIRRYESNDKDITPVYFTGGDERRAIRKFIEENYDFVKGCIEGHDDTLRRRFDGIIRQVFAEEWYTNGVDRS
ncbi:MAG: hypothetical protein SXQ77_03925 [Halobacteria archaeon]|nr:hypothetical protein [Halobacteria archaeon]